VARQAAGMSGFDFSNAMVVVTGAGAGSPPELDFFARELEGQLPVRVDKVLLADLAAVVRRGKHTGQVFVDRCGC